jgi:SHS2 domain-containing protein
LSHRYLAHTADLLARVEGADAASLYQAAADLVREILVGRSAVGAVEERRLEAEGEDEAERFFRFVRSLLYLYDSEGFLPARVTDAGRDGAVRVRGELFDAARHASEHQVKALTRHGYRFERSAAGYAAELLFDL